MSAHYDEIEELQKRLTHLQSYVDYLQVRLRDNYISFNEMRTVYTDENSTLKPADENPPQIQTIDKEDITPNHVRFFYSLFKGRRDVYSKRGGRPNPKTGKVGYYTQCWNFWKSGICPKQAGEKVACSACSKQRYKELMGGVLMEHLKGEKEDGSDVIGLYAMMPDETCNFLVFDFDYHTEELDSNEYDWIDEVQALRQICLELGVPVLVERSRSGRGAHIWIFFQEPIPAKIARQFGSALLTKGAESVSLKNFRSYDRMIPAQDHLPAGGLGNLIALPLQGAALKNANSAFVDERWHAYTNQWQELHNIKKIAPSFVSDKIEEWSTNGILGQLSCLQRDDEILDPDAKPWEKQKPRFNQADADGDICITLANRIYILQNNLKPRLQNQIRRLAAFGNPKYYKNQAMGFSTNGISRIIACGRDETPYISIPRGCKENLISQLEEAGISYQLADERQKGRAIQLSFKATLYPEQQRAAEAMLKHESGILSAATAFGKTALGAYLIAAHKINTLILVHNTEILKNWVDDLAKFLDIQEPSPTYQTKQGRTKTRKSPIGRLQASHCSLTGIIDVAMISSLGKRGEIKPIAKEYGLVIMDECHHAAAITAEDVLNEVSAQYVYGLTATPKRDDGHELKMLMQLGPIRHKYTAKEKALQQGIAHYIYPRFTRLIHPNTESLSINETYKLVRTSEIRNRQIVEDVKDCINKGRTPLVLSKFKNHAALLYEQLSGASDHIFLLQGGRSSKERDSLRQKMNAVPAHESVIIVAIGQYIGEGFNYPRLDTLILATPIAWQGNVEQYAGRLHRDFAGKKDVVIYDYVDAHIKVLERMYHKRLRAYRKIAYEIYDESPNDERKHNLIYQHDNYIKDYEHDLETARQSIVILSSFISPAKAKSFAHICRQAQARGVHLSIITTKASSIPNKLIPSMSEAIAYLEALGIHVNEQERLHINAAIIDNCVVWYSSMNLMTKGKSDAHLMRLNNKKLAHEMLEIHLTE